MIRVGSYPSVCVIGHYFVSAGARDRPSRTDSAMTTTERTPSDVSVILHKPISDLGDPHVAFAIVRRLDQLPLEGFIAANRRDTLTDELSRLQALNLP